MVQLIKAEGGCDCVDVRDGDHLRELVGGWLEVVRTRDDRIMVIDEEGKLKGKPLNQPATILYGSTADYIAGDAVLMDRPDAYRLLNDGNPF